MLPPSRLLAGTVQFAPDHRVLFVNSAADPFVPLAARQLDGGTIMLAEDNLVNQLLAVRLLEKRGHTITTVQDGTEALAAVRRQTFDLVLLDIEMPHVDGLEVCRRLKQNPETRLTPVVLVTAYSDAAKDPKNTGKDEPMVWVARYGKGRVCNNALGHDVRDTHDLTDPLAQPGGSQFIPGAAQFQSLIVNGIKSAMGLIPFCT